MISSNLTFFFTDIVTIEDLTETSKITGFDNCDSDEYLKNVKRALCNFREEFNYDSANVTLQKMTSMFDRYGGENSKCCIPRIDAIGLLLRRSFCSFFSRSVCSGVLEFSSFDSSSKSF